MLYAYIRNWLYLTLNGSQNIRKRDTSEEMIINKRRKTDDSKKLDVLISMKDEERYRLLKPRFKSNSEITEKSQCIVESIFGKLKINEDIIFSKEYSSSDESLLYKRVDTLEIQAPAGLWKIQLDIP